MRYISVGKCEVVGCREKAEWIEIIDNEIVSQLCNNHFPPEASE